jgi:hypothetical protein
MRYYSLLFTLVLISIISCRKSDPSRLILEPGSSIYGKSILVDASKDGGVWWFPQNSATGFSASTHHQGRNLADYLRSLGYVVDEIPSGTIITATILDRYNNVIRAGGAGNYTQDEIAAYQSFLGRPSSLLLLQDHLTNFPNDQLSISLHVPFEGAEAGTITSFISHPVTTGVSSFPFMTGSVIRNPNATQMTILGSVDVIANGSSTSAGAMGILHHATSRIFFIGDLNGLEGIPQPFTLNLTRWLFR